MSGAWLTPDWQADAHATMTTRLPPAAGGDARSAGDFNLGDHVGDDPLLVAQRRSAFARCIGAQPVYLRQVHGARVVRLTLADLQPGADAHEADASVCSEPGTACTVLVADCMPILFAAPGRRAVAAAHAGWRGLSQGIAETTLAALCDVAACEPADVAVWLGACIGPRRFEVGHDVLEAFGSDPSTPDPAHFMQAPAVDGVAKWFANLPQLARDRLSRAGVRDVSGGVWCTVEDASRFFSFRRDRITGRMAAAVWL